MSHHYDPSIEAELSHRRIALQQDASRHHLSRLAARAARVTRPTRPTSRARV